MGVWNKKNFKNRTMDLSNISPFVKGHPLTLFQAGMGKFCPHHPKSLVNLKWTLQMSSYFMTLFLWTFYRSHWSQFSKKNFWKFWKIENKKNSVTTPKGPPFKKKSKKIIKNDFLKKNIILFQPESEFYKFLPFFWCK